MRRFSDLKWREPLPGARPACPVARFFVNNRRDGSRLLSSAVVICGAALLRIDHPLGLGVGVGAGALSLYWWYCYRQLQS